MGVYKYYTQLSINVKDNSSFESGTYFNVGANNHAQQAAVDNVCYRTVFPTNEPVFTSVQEQHIQQSQE